MLSDADEKIIAWVEESHGGQHLARLLARVVADLPTEKIDRYVIRDAQRLIEAIETLVRIHAAQEDDIYDAVAAP